jgi:hypothetical protein
MRLEYRGFSHLVSAALVVTLSLGVLGTVPAGAAAAPSSTLRCGVDTLTVVWRGTTGGLAGSFGDLFWIRNVGEFACVISGYPLIAFYKDGKRVDLNAEDYLGHMGNDEMGVAKGRRPPTVRLTPNGGTASFWIFGEDVMTPCLNASQIVVSLKSLSGRAVIPTPRGFQWWPYCGHGVAVNPIVPGVSGSDPARPLRSEIMG